MGLFLIKKNTIGLGYALWCVCSVCTYFIFQWSCFSLSTLQWFSQMQTACTDYIYTWQSPAEYAQSPEFVWESLSYFDFLQAQTTFIFRVKVTLCSLFCHSRYVCIAMEALDQLLMACHCQSINLFVESFLKMVRKLLESDKPSLQILGTNSVSFQDFTIALYQFDDSHCL